jgi:F-type H+-transporting ATPase subunit b
MGISRSNKKLRLLLVGVLVMIMLGVLVVNPLAAEENSGTSNFKKNWMKVWEVLNFLILAFFLVKLLKTPLMNFFRERSGMISEEIGAAEEATRQAESELQEIERRVETLDEEIRRLQGIIGEQGDKERERIVAQARETADHMIERARLESAMLTNEARDRLRQEVVDMALSAAEATVRKKINEKDQDRLVDEYLQDLKQVAT